MSTDIARRSDFPTDTGQQLQMAKALAEAGVLPAHLRRQPANILAIGMAARAMDVPLWTALQGVVMIDGKAAVSADLMKALILRAGHRIRVEHADPASATVVIVRHDDPDYEHRVVVSIDEIPADLRKKTNWQNWPADMLVARATSKAARRACSDVLAGMAYVPEELGADVDEDGTVQVTTTRPPTSTPLAADVVDAIELVDSRLAYDPSYDDNLPGTREEATVVIQEAIRAGNGGHLELDVVNRRGRGLSELTRGELRDEWRHQHADYDACQASE